MDRMRTQWKHVLFTAIPDDVSHEDVIKYLHDPVGMIRLSPVVTEFHTIPSEASQGTTYDIKESIGFLPMGYWNQDINFQCVFEDREDGLRTKLNAPLGLESEATYTVMRIVDEQEMTVLDAEGNKIATDWVLKEEIVSSCNMLLKSFVNSSMVPTRRVMSKRLIDAVKTREMNSQ